jgi:tetratricopeptide (TPR) repeat protein
MVLNIRNITSTILTLLALITACSSPKGQKPEPEHLGVLTADSLTTLIAQYPRYAPLYYHRGKQYEALNQLNPALTDYKQALTIDTLTADYYFAAADLFLRAGQSEQTLNLLLKANKLIPKNAQILYRLANLHFYVTNYKAANEYLAQALETDPYFAPAYLTRALIQRENGDTTQAIINLQVAVERNPQYFEAYMVLASLCAQTNNVLAVDYYKNAITIQPQSYEAYYGLAMYY